MSEPKCTQRRFNVGNTVEVVCIQDRIIETDIGAIPDRVCQRIGVAFDKCT